MPRAHEKRRGCLGGDTRQHGEHCKKTLETISERLLRGKGGGADRIVKGRAAQGSLETISERRLTLGALL